MSDSPTRHVRDPSPPVPLLTYLTCLTHCLTD